MSILSASNLGKSYGAQLVFENLSFAIPQRARIALIGPNGSGKTTLLCLMAGLDVPTGGVVHRARDAHIAYLPQQAEFVLNEESGTLWDVMLEVFADLRAQADELRRLEAAMANEEMREAASRRYGSLLEAFERAGGYAYQYRIEQVLAGLGFEEKDFHRPVAQFSGGQKTRALLARLLLEEPELLLLDEPTNHLDLAGVEWLEDYLKAWRGAVVVVAHDRAFLDAVAEEVWELEWGRLERYRANYSGYVTQKAERMARRQAEYEQQQEFIARTEEFIRRNIAGQRSREAQGRRKRLERMERIDRPREYHRPLNISLGDVTRSGDLVLGLYDLVVGYDPDVPLFTAEDFELRRGDRVVLLGPNGSGKTALMQTILGEIPPLDGQMRVGASVHLGSFAQGHTNLDPRKSALDTVLAAGDLTVGEARDLLARYGFFEDDVFKLVGDLSGGEQARVALAVLILQGANVLILDEPTNHLDIPSQEVLEDVLTNFGGSGNGSGHAMGTLLMVTHDRYLARKLAASVWTIDDGGDGIGQLRAFDGGYDDYRAWETQRQEQASLAPEDEAKQRRKQAWQARKAAKREEERRARRQAELEQQIQQLEARLAELERQLARASEQQAVEKVRELGAEHRRVEEELDALLADWTELA